MTEQTPKKNSKVIFLVVLLAASLIGNIFQALQTKGKTETITEQKTLYDTLVLEHQGTVELYEESMALVEGLKADSIKTNAEIEGKVSEIQQLQQEIQELKKNSKNKAKLAEDLNKKFKKMKQLNDDLQKDIEKLLLENKALYDKNVALKGNVDSLTGVTADLGKKVNTGAKLRAEYVITTTYKKKDSGFKPSLLAKKADRFEARFFILENSISEKAEKMAYLRILAPNGKVLGTPAMSSDVFKAENGEEIKFSSKKKFNNTGEKQSLSLVFDDADMVYEKGEYKVEIYIDGYLSGQSNIVLR